MIEQTYRLATDNEITFYHDRLYPLQDIVFAEATVFADAIYLTGGTALARFHFQHRLSEDLDFFTQDAQLPYIANDLIARLQHRGLNVAVEQVSAWFVRFFVVDQEVRLKIDLVRDALLTGDLVRLPQGVFTNSLLDIGANKITAFKDRAEIKDIIDLYYICQGVELPALFALADRKRVPVAYEQLLTINQQGVSGSALLTKPIAAAALHDFLLRLQLATEMEVKKKRCRRRGRLSRSFRISCGIFRQKRGGFQNSRGQYCNGGCGACPCRGGGRLQHPCAREEWVAPSYQCT